MTLRQIISYATPEKLRTMARQMDPAKVPVDIPQLIEYIADLKEQMLQAATRTSNRERGW